MSHLLTLCNNKSVDIFDEDSIRESIDLTVIATGLSNKCRYNGQTKEFYSVAMHCLLLASWFKQIGKPELIPIALMHDCAEALLPDIPAPIKDLLAIKQPLGEIWIEITHLEFIIQDTLFAKFGLDISLLDAIADADVAIRETEMHYLFGTPAPKELMISAKQHDNMGCYTPKGVANIFLEQITNYIPCA
jgi:hypothetical protein